MESIFVRYDEYMKKIISIEDNDIDLWWKNICERMPLHLKEISLRSECLLEKDSSFDSSTTLGQRYFLTTENKDINLFLKRYGPFIVLVGAT